MCQTLHLPKGNTRINDTEIAPIKRGPAKTFPDLGAQYVYLTSLLENFLEELLDTFRGPFYDCFCCSLATALFFDGAASDQGKTTIYGCVGAYFTNQGKVFGCLKPCPDYLDPQILAQAAKQPD